MLLVHSVTDSPRWKYIAHTLLADLAGISFMHTSDAEAYGRYEGPTMNYGLTRIRPDEFHIIPHGLLDEPGIMDREMDMLTHNGQPAMFAVQGGDLPFDLRPIPPGRARLDSRGRPV